MADEPNIEETGVPDTGVSDTSEPAAEEQGPAEVSDTSTPQAEETPEVEAESTPGGVGHRRAGGGHTCGGRGV